MVSRRTGLIRTTILSLEFSIFFQSRNIGLTFAGGTRECFELQHVNLGANKLHVNPSGQMGTTRNK